MIWFLFNVIDVDYSLTIFLIFLFLGFVILTIYLGIKIVPQSDVFVIERFGKYSRTLNAGLSIIVPYLDKVAHKVSILERQLKEFTISVITSDNVEVSLNSTVFYRVTDASRSVYRIKDIDSALKTAATSIVRSAAGKLDLDGLQSSRDSMNSEIDKKLSEAAEVWGIEVTRTEITDVEVDEDTKKAQRQQLNAERARRAAVAEAEGEKKSIELKADAQLYESQKEAEAIKIKADAEAYEVKTKAKADAEQTTLLANAISKNGKPAVEFEVMKRQVSAIGELAKSNSTKTIILPTDVTKILGTLETFLSMKSKNKIMPIEVLSFLTLWMLNSKVWLIIGILIVCLELIDGSFIFFFTNRLSSLINSLILYIQNNQIIIENEILRFWYHPFLSLAILSLIFSILLQKFSKRKNEEDINDY